MMNRCSGKLDPAPRPPELGLVGGSTDEGEQRAASRDASPMRPYGLLSSTSTVSSCGSEDLQHSLNLAKAFGGGDKVVTAHGDELRTSFPQLPCPAREQTHEGGLFKNPEELPLGQAAQDLPAGLYYPLAQHIMTRTNEQHVAIGDDSNKAADGGTLRQKTIHLKNLIGKSAKKAKHIAEKYTEKAVKKVKGVRADTAQLTQQQQQQQQQQSDDDNHAAETPVPTNTDGGKLKQRTEQLKEFVGKSMKKSRHMVERFGEKIVGKVRSVQKDTVQPAQKQQSVDDRDDDWAETSDTVHNDVFHADQDDEGKPYTGPAKVRAAHGFDAPLDFDRIKVVQDLSGEHAGAVWTMKFSPCGRLLATAGQDKVVRVWVLKNALDYFNGMRMKHNNAEGCSGTSSPSPSQKGCSESDSDVATEPPEGAADAPFCPVPFCKFAGHTSEVLDLSWSKYRGHMSDFLDPSWSENFFLLSCSMDRTVRLWHVSRGQCLCCFQHGDFVTAVAFHPRKNWFFLSGCLDGKLHLWNILDKRMVLWNDVNDGPGPQLVTAASFCGAGRYVVVGTYDGRCIFYDTERLKFRAQLIVSSKVGGSAAGRKITGIESLPGENKILVSSNDSRVRLYNLADMSLVMKYKGHANSRSQIKASFNHDHSFIVSGSEDKYVYVWSTYPNLSGRSPSGVHRHRNDFWEGFKVHNAVVTTAIFAPHPGLVVAAHETGVAAGRLEAECKSMGSADSETVPPGALLKMGHAEVLVSADFTGAIKVLTNVKGREAALKPDTGLQRHGGAPTRWDDSSSGSSRGTCSSPASAIIKR